MNMLFSIWFIISRIAFCQIQAPGLFDEVYGSILKGKKENYNVTTMSWESVSIAQS